MAATDVTKKLLIYHTLYRLNLSFSNIVTHCRTLQDTRVFTSKSARLFQGYAQELQAEMNQELLDTMHTTELDDWGRFGKIRQAEGSAIAMIRAIENRVLISLTASQGYATGLVSIATCTRTTTRRL
jgi:hypothetical protein